MYSSIYIHLGTKGLSPHHGGKIDSHRGANTFTPSLMYNCRYRCTNPTNNNNFMIGFLSTHLESSTMSLTTPSMLKVAQSSWFESNQLNSSVKRLLALMSNWIRGSVGWTQKCLKIWPCSRSTQGTHVFSIACMTTGKITNENTKV